MTIISFCYDCEHEDTPEDKHRTCPNCGSGNTTLRWINDNVTPSSGGLLEDIAKMNQEFDELGKEKQKK